MALAQVEHEPRPIDDDADILADIRRRIAERDEPADFTDHELRAALRIALADLARQYEDDLPRSRG
jgi:hypothetical protein